MNKEENPSGKDGSVGMDTQTPGRSDWDKSEKKVKRDCKKGES